MRDRHFNDDREDLGVDNVNELIVTADRRSLNAIKRAVAPGVPGATPCSTVCRDWHRSLHVTYSAPGGCGLPVAGALANTWRRASFVLAFDFRCEERGGHARWEGGALTAVGYDTSYDGDGPYGDYITVADGGGDSDCAMMEPRRLAGLCSLARRYGWRPGEQLLRALDASLDPIDGRLLRESPEMDLLVATLPAAQAATLAAALAVARGCVGVPEEILDRSGIRGDVPPGGAYGTGRGGGTEEPTLRTIREVRDLASAGVDLVVMRTILARPAAG